MTKKRTLFDEFPDLDERAFSKDDIDLLLKIYLDKRITNQINFYENRIRENQRNSDFTFNLATAIMTLSSLLATISATVTSSQSILVNLFPVFSAVLPALAALLAAFRQLYGWDRQILIYRDSLLGLERARLLLPDDDRMARADLMAIFPKLVAASEDVFAGEASQWGQFVLARLEDEKEDFAAALAKLGLTEEQVIALKAIAGAGRGSGDITISAETLATSIMTGRASQAALSAGPASEAPPSGGVVAQETVHTVTEVTLHVGESTAAPVADFVDLDGDGAPDEPVLLDEVADRDGVGVEDASGVVDMAGFQPPTEAFAETFVDLDGDGVPDEPVLLDEVADRDGVGVEDASGVVDMAGFEPPIDSDDPDDPNELADDEKTPTSAG
jgi:hypothetical protein